ncbi:forespore capture DNA-binding protein RefZ [Halalkalibacter akibai]|uniref:Transcriptional regulator n=1 Tax=Halalkalibacter akibai (strain ATCC 43226 / DSM 21942 / CIP 109018 / JCM 9157 / 1139) TaxID=1236973 RepID=W4QQG1_HALA3|nr:forespore capture DNA-binding protein RefZ [Halalkalibacter akibai]GAE34157.1 transcriptional regulator [Halalkalibacter akibai JCM 9157]
MKETKKEKILDAAARLFYTQGYDGTSVRDIASKAKVNVALVSYHFGGKKGLYEELMTQFFEGYLHVIKEETEKISNSIKDQLLSVIQSLIEYQSAQHYVARMVHREMTFDSMLVRELMSTYLRKEKHDLEGMLRNGMRRGEFRKQPTDLVVVHLRTMITIPFLSPHYLSELYQITTTEPYFIDKYMRHVSNWIQLWLCVEEVRNTPAFLLPRSIS